MIYSIAPSGRRPNVLPSPAEQSKSATGKSVRFSGLMAASSSTRLVKIIAPAGGLGIVVKASPESGLSYVSRIKDNSPIKDQIRVGDLILEVDGEDVSKLRVIHVAMLIRSKRNSGNRMLTVSRAKDETTNVEII